MDTVSVGGMQKDSDGDVPLGKIAGALGGHEDWMSAMLEGIFEFVYSALYARHPIRPW